MKIRQLADDNLSELLDLYRHLHANDSPLPSMQAISAVWTEILNNERIRYFGLFIESKLVSSCTITIIPNLTRSCRPYGLIENVVTHAEHRKRGYATALLHSALEHAWSLGCYKVMLMTGRKDDATLHFYQSAGFDSNGKQAFIAKPYS